jgi:transposase
LGDLQQSLIRLDEREEEMSQQIHTSIRSAKRLQSNPKIGSISATAILCAVGDGRPFKRGRDGKERLLGISKRGDTYLRTLLIQDAKSVLKVVDKKLTLVA